MPAATAGLIGAALGFCGNSLVAWINRHFDERKARRELLVKTAWDYFSSRYETAKVTGGRNGTSVKGATRARRYRPVPHRRGNIPLQLVGSFLASPTYRGTKKNALICVK
jgi:hypothetical protein